MPTLPDYWPDGHTDDEEGPDDGPEGHEPGVDELGEDGHPAEEPDSYWDWRAAEAEGLDRLERGLTC